MAKKLSNLIFHKTEAEYKSLYMQEFVHQEICTHDGKVVVFQEGNFHHIFYRDKDTSAPRFDKPLAQRMLQIKDILICSISDIEVYENFNIRNNRTERSYVFVYGKLCIFLGYEADGVTLFPITAYIKTNKELDRIRNSKNITRVK